MNGESSQNRRSGQHKRPQNLQDLKSAMASLESALEQLKTKVRTLPRVESDGSSECPFAANLYIDKEEATEKVNQRLQEVRGYLPLLEREIARCSHNLSTISADKGNLHDEKAIEQYQAALHAQQHHYQKAIDQKMTLLDLIKRVEQLLKGAEAKKYPGSTPERKFQPPPAVLGGPAAPGRALPSLNPMPEPTPSPALPRSELGNLLSLGPLPGKPRS